LLVVSAFDPIVSVLFFLSNQRVVDTVVEPPLNMATDLNGEGGIAANNNTTATIASYSSDASSSAYPANLELAGVSDTNVAINVKQPPALGRSERLNHEVPDEDDIVVVNNVHKTYLLGVEGVPALRGVSLKIKRGEFIVILGKSGGGKTSLLNIIGTIDKPTKGELFICGKRITNKTTDAEFAMLRLRKIGFVFQTFNLISSMTAQENVELPMILDGRLEASVRKERAKKLLTRVGIGARTDHLPSQLSGGEQQRVTIARSISNSPEILLLDEPTGDLDTKNSHIVLQMLMDLNRKHGITCVMVTHDTNLSNFASRVVHMVDGKIFNIEVVSAERRAEAERDLAAKLNNESAPKEAEAHTEFRNPAQFYSFDTYPVQYAAEAK